MAFSCKIDVFEAKANVKVGISRDIHKIYSVSRTIKKKYNTRTKIKLFYQLSRYNSFNVYSIIIY